MDTTKVLILGGTGMLGHVLFTQLSQNPSLNVFSTVRSSSEGFSDNLPPKLVSKIRPYVDANDFDTVTRALAAIQPDIVINCIGLVKQLPIAGDPLSAITVNSQMPHRVSLICRAAKARLIHISTDCVFDGRKGNYTEQDLANATDLYGRTKFLGEVSYPHCVTLRTSIIGHELRGKHGIVEWFLAQKGSIKGYTKAIFSGVTTLEMAKVINDYVIPNQDLNGVYQVSTSPISKFDLLKLLASVYKRDIEIEPYDGYCIDRSLNSSLFNRKTGYMPPFWPELIDNMYKDFIASPLYRK